MGCPPPSVGAPIPTPTAAAVSPSCEVCIPRQVATKTLESTTSGAAGTAGTEVLLLVLMFFSSFGCCRYFSFSFLRSYPVSSSRRRTPTAALRSHRGCFLLPLTIHPYCSGRCYSKSWEAGCSQGDRLLQARRRGILPSTNTRIFFFLRCF